MVSGAVVFVFILGVVGFLYLNPAYSLSPKTVSFVAGALARQEKVELELMTAYRAGKYTFVNPMVVQDPYQTAPLTALLLFDTPEVSQISIHVPGKSAQTAVDFTFPGYQTHHEIPIYGLYADTLNRVTVTMKTQSGQNAQHEIDLQTEPLLIDMPTFVIDRVDASRYSPGFNFAFQYHKPVFDLDGNVRWYSSEKSDIVFTPLKNGRFLFTYTVDNNEENKIIMEQDLLGKISAIYNIADGIHHDITELPTGNLLITSADLKSNTLEDYLIEVDRKNGHIVRSIDLKNILDPGRQPVIGMSTKDWLHLNSIIYDGTDKTIIISSYSQSAVIKMTYPGMQIKWILGAPDNWKPKFQPYLLTPSGKNFEWPWSQHHATVYGARTPGNGTIEILLFNNGQYRSFDPAKAATPPEWYSDVVHYRINEAAMTIEQVWEYGKIRGAETFSDIYGSAYLLSNGDVLGTWGNIFKDSAGNPAISSSTGGKVNSKIIEVDPTNNNVVFECSMPGTSTYRTMRAGLYDRYTETNIDPSQAVNNTSGNDLLDRSGMAWRDLRRWTYTNPVILAIRRLGRRLIQAL